MQIISRQAQIRLQKDSVWEGGREEGREGWEEESLTESEGVTFQSVLFVICSRSTKFIREKYISMSKCVPDAVII